MTTLTTTQEAVAGGVAMRCPWCGRKLRRAPFMPVAVTRVRRTCPNAQCATQWSVLIKPIEADTRIGRMWIHELTFTETTNLETNNDR